MVLPNVKKLPISHSLKKSETTFKYLISPSERVKRLVNHTAQGPEE